MTVQNVLLSGSWRPAHHSQTFRANDPRTNQAIEGEYPISTWEDVDAALDSAQAAFSELRGTDPDRIAEFLELFAERIEARADELCALASQETALPVEPRLLKGELPRTTGQLRQAAAAARSADWTVPVIDTSAGIRTHFAPLGPVLVIGPNNFPLAFGSVSGGDFAAAIAAGNPVIAKGHPLHPGTTRILAEEALAALEGSGLPRATVQMIYHLESDAGDRLIPDPRVAAIAFTGSKATGLKIKAAADAVGKPTSLELGSTNPVIVLPGALAERSADIAAELTTSCLMGTGQFCTNPGLVIMETDDHTEAFLQDVSTRFAKAPAGVLFSQAGEAGLAKAVEDWKRAGAEVVTGGDSSQGDACSYANTVLRISGEGFLKQPEALQAEAFGNATLVVLCDSGQTLEKVLTHIEGNLTGCIYSAKDGTDDSQYGQVAPVLRQRVGRLLNDQMPTGVAVSPAMNHGGPFPASGHPGFTSVGIPASLTRFAMLQCYDQVRAERLPEGLRDANPRRTWRRVDGRWTQADL